MSRVKFDKMFLKERPPIDKHVPGPAVYSVNSKFVEKSAAAYSLRPHTAYQSIYVNPFKSNPGPGAYESTKASDSKNGFTLSAKYKSYGGAVISKNSRRFENYNERVAKYIPGPG